MEERAALRHPVVHLLFECGAFDPSLLRAKSLANKSLELLDVSAAFASLDYRYIQAHARMARVLPLSAAGSASS